jgi:transcriptional regulator with XRE-family HTH domain
MQIVRKYMERHGITGYRLSKMTNVSQPAISRASKQSLDTFSFKNLKALAKTIDVDVGTVANELFEMEENVLKRTAKETKLVNSINEAQENSDQKNKILKIVSYTELSEFENVQEKNIIDKDSTSIMVICNSDNQGIYVVDLSQRGAFGVARDFFALEAYDDLYDLTSIFEV